MIGQYTIPLPTSRLYVHHTILVRTISCKEQTEVESIPAGTPGRRHDSKLGLAGGLVYDTDGGTACDVYVYIYMYICICMYVCI